MTRRAQIPFLLALMAVVGLVQAVTISRAVVPALDAVRFVDSAKVIDEAGFLGFLREQTEQPLFPISVWGVHRLVVGCSGEFRQAWAVSVQIAAALPLILLPIPVFCLARQLVGPRSAILGTILVITLPEVIRLGADGISDSTHLLLFSVALALLAQHLGATNRSATKVVVVLLAGAATGLALLTRLEVVVLAAAFFVVLIHRAVRDREFLWASGLAYVAGLALILLPYALLLVQADLARAAVAGPVEIGLDRVSALGSTSSERLCFAPKDPTTSIRKRGLLAAVLQLVDELPKAFAYVPGVLALVGLWSLSRKSNTPADLLLQTFCAMLLAAVLLHTVREGYLAARHLLPIAVAASGCLGVGVATVAEWVRRLPNHGDSDRAKLAAPAIVATLAIASVCTLYGIRPVHGSRMGHRSAAEWLAMNACPGDRVVDTQGWTGLYSGLNTIFYEDSRSELACGNLRYVVIEDRELSYESSRSRTIRRLLQTAGTLAADFKVGGGDSNSASVLVFRWDSNQP